MHKIKKIANNLITPGGTLSQRVAKGGFWVFLLRIVNRGVSLIRLIIIARILAPSDFGLLGIALLSMSTLETFSQTGFQQALIQKKEDIRSYLDASWTALILRGLILFVILYFIAPYVAIFFDISEAKPIIRVIGFAILFRAFSNIGVIYFRKELEFNKEFIYQFAGTLADFIVAISAVFILRNVWALVLGMLAGNIVRCLMSYLIHPYRPRLNFNLEKIKELFGFGKWILGSSILVFLLTQGDDIFVGKLLGTTALGFYQMAYKISNMPATEYSHLIATVTFPAYSKLQDNLSKLKEAFLKVLQLTAFLSIPIAGGIFILAPDFTKIFLGIKWMPMVPAMQVLALYGMLRAIGATTGVIFMAVGKPEIRTKIQSAQLVLLAILIYPLTMRWGILGASMAVTAYALIFNFVAVYKVLTIVKSDFIKPVKIFVLPFVGTLIMICTIFLMKSYAFDNLNILSFFSLIVSGIFAYLLIVYLSDLFFDYGSKNFIQEQFEVFFIKSKRYKI